jgi:peroxiredoxin
MARELGIGFPLLSDGDLRVATAYGVAMKDEEIAIPSVFVVAPDRSIVWRQIGETMLDRAAIEDILGALDRAPRPQ